MNCTFCGIITNKIHGPYREKKPLKIVEEIKQDIKNYEVNRFGFTDELININPIGIRKICDIIIKNKLDIKWLAEAFPHITNDDLGKMYDSGCRFLYLCPETGNPKTAKLMKKGINLKTVEKTIKDASKIGIGVSSWFIVGFPGETIDDIKVTEKFVEKIQPYCIEIVFTPFSLYKGSYVHNHPREFGIQYLEETPMDLVIRKYYGKAILSPFESIRLSLMLWDKYDVTGLSYPFLNHSKDEIEALLSNFSPEKREEVASYIHTSSKKETYEYKKIFDIAFHNNDRI